MDRCGWCCQNINACCNECRQRDNGKHTVQHRHHNKPRNRCHHHQCRLCHFRYNEYAVFVGFQRDAVARIKGGEYVLFVGYRPAPAAIVLRPTTNSSIRSRFPALRVLGEITEWHALLWPGLTSNTSFTICCAAFSSSSAK